VSYQISSSVLEVARVFAENNMTHQVNLLRGSLGVVDPSTGASGGLVDAVVLYTGKARIHPVAGFGPLEVGGGILDERQVTVSIPMTAATPNRDDLIEVLDGGRDTDLLHGYWRVVQVYGGGYFNEARRMFCNSWHPSRYWGQQ
jgi:hypothetical protein